MIPYGKQTIDENDIQSVVKILRSDWLTTGPKVEEFEGTLRKAFKPDKKKMSDEEKS